MTAFLPTLLSDAELDLLCCLPVHAMRHSVSAAATPGGREAAATSFVRALQQLGHSCGQSVMAADLAAFVTHKQLLGGVVAVEAALQHSRPAGGSAQSGVWGRCIVGQPPTGTPAR